MQQRPATSTFAPNSRPGTSSLPVNPVSPRTWQTLVNEKSNVSLFTNDLYGQERPQVMDVRTSPSYQPLSARNHIATAAGARPPSRLAQDGGNPFTARSPVMESTNCGSSGPGPRGFNRPTNVPRLQLSALNGNHNVLQRPTSSASYVTASSTSVSLPNSSHSATAVPSNNPSQQHAKQVGERLKQATANLGSNASDNIHSVPAPMKLTSANSPKPGSILSSSAGKGAAASGGTPSALFQGARPTTGSQQQPTVPVRPTTGVPGTPGGSSKFLGTPRATTTAAAGTPKSAGAMTPRTAAASLFSQTDAASAATTAAAMKESFTIKAATPIVSASVGMGSTVAAGQQSQQGRVMTGTPAASPALHRSPGFRSRKNPMPDNARSQPQTNTGSDYLTALDKKIKTGNGGQTVSVTAAAGSESDTPKTREARQSTASIKAQLRRAVALTLNNIGNGGAALRSLMTKPGPTGEALRCRILRQKGGLLRGQDQYMLVLEEESFEVLIAKRQRRANGTVSFKITPSEMLYDKNYDGKEPMGRVYSNFLGTEFNFIDSSEVVFQGDRPREMGAVMYASNVMGTKGPRKMTVIVPKPGASTQEASAESPMSTDGPTQLIAQYKEGQAEGLMVLRNKPPRWNDALKAYCLNFGGRVTMASVKNFQLVSMDDVDNVIVQFGKISSDEFTLDFKYPMTPLQAFAVALTSLDSKLACE